MKTSACLEPENDNDQYNQAQKAMTKIGDIINTAMLNMNERILSKLKNMKISELRLALSWIDNGFGGIGQFIGDFVFDDDEDLYDLIRKALDDKVKGIIPQHNERRMFYE
ncbi:MAG: hypothetical protein HQK97_04545 [Nitrospirae bacterium]|nr:hypothetical protein [Nitrospirota bacterium]